MTIPTITVNEDVKCPQCGKPGACKRPDGEYGICLKCATKNIGECLMEMSKTRKMVEAEIRNLINTEWPRITKAYENSYYELGISIKVGLSSRQDTINMVKIVTGIEYYPLPKTKVTNGPTFVDEKQMSLALNT